MSDDPTFRITQLERGEDGHFTARVCSNGDAVVVNCAAGSWLVPRDANPHLEWPANATYKEVLSPFREALAAKVATVRRRELAALGPDDQAPDLIVESMRQATLRRARTKVAA